MVRTIKRNITLKLNYITNLQIQLTYNLQNLKLHYYYIYHTCLCAIIICIIIIVHVLDDAFFQAYMKNNLNSLEVAGSNNDTFTENCSGHIANSKFIKI